MRIDGETGGQLLISTILIVVVVAIVFRVAVIRRTVTGLQNVS